MKTNYDLQDIDSRVGEVEDLLLTGGGGGLTVTPVTHTIHNQTLNVLRHYIVNMSNAVSDVNVYMPLGETGGNIRVSVVPPSPLYKLSVLPTGGNTFVYSGISSRPSMYFPAGAETWAEFCWNGTSYSVVDNTNPMSGTFSGDIAFTGLLSAISGLNASGLSGKYMGSLFSPGTLGGNLVVQGTLTVPSNTQMVLILVTGDNYGGNDNTHTGYYLGVFSVSAGNRVFTIASANHSAGAGQGFSASYAGGVLTVANNSGMVNSQSGNVLFVVFG